MREAGKTRLNIGELDKLKESSFSELEILQSLGN